MSPRVFGGWIDRAADLADSYRNAAPFPHVIIDRFLDDSFAQLLFSEFPAPGDMPKSRDYVFGNKRELSSVEAQGPNSKIYHEALLSSDFQAAISSITGQALFVDPLHHGGGFHQGGDGSFLDTHVDFNVHPAHPDWLRSLNILLYLPKEWLAEYDGALLLRRSPTDEPVRVMPAFNRAVLMRTGDDTYHGYRKMSLPAGVTRKLIATYAYKKIEIGSVNPHTTGWAPEEGRLKQLLARAYDPLVRSKNRWFGSGTAKNR